MPCNASDPMETEQAGSDESGSGATALDKEKRDKTPAAQHDRRQAHGWRYLFFLSPSDSVSNFWAAQVDFPRTGHRLYGSGTQVHLCQFD